MPQSSIEALVLGIEERITYWSRFRIGTLVITFLEIFIKIDIEDGLLFFGLLISLVLSYKISGTFLKFRFFIEERLKEDLVEIRYEFLTNKNKNFPKKQN